LHFSGSQRTVIYGPFIETKNSSPVLAVAGEINGRGRRMGQAIPNPMEGACEIEIRPVFEAADFGVELTPELRVKEEYLRAEAKGVAKRPG
jgi:hypothetical protein